MSVFINAQIFTNETDKSIQIVIMMQNERLSSNTEMYKKKLIEEFALDIPDDIEIHYSTFRGEEGFPAQYNLFENKKWIDVNFDIFRQHPVDAPSLNTTGLMYYLPAYLLYLYDMKNQVCPMIKYSFEYHFRYYKTSSKDIKKFQKLTAGQSKLVALYLLNQANLSEDSTLAQNALSSYWGKFLFT